MRRFLNANLHINTSASTDNPSSSSTSPATTRSPQPQSNDQHNPLSSTKRAFQHTFVQLSRGSSNKSNTSTSSNGHASQSVKLDSNSHASSSSSSVINSPVPPTPPSKHGHTLDQDDEHEEHDDSSWDDAFKLPFGSSSLIARASSSASASSAHASPYEGMIERTSSTTTSSHRSNSTRSTEHRYGSVSDDEGDPDETARHPGQRASTATISASRMMMNGNLVSPSSTRNMAISLHSPPHSATSMLFSPSSNNGISPGLAVSATYAANASSLVDLKDEMMLELLSSDALIHVAQFEILGFDEVEDLRKVSFGPIIPLPVPLCTHQTDSAFVPVVIRLVCTTFRNTPS